MTDRISETRVGKIRQTMSEMLAYRFCGPSDDPDEISAVTLGYRHLLIQLQRAAGPVLPAPLAARLDTLEVEPNDLFSALNAHAEVEALMLDIEEEIEGRLPQDGGLVRCPQDRCQSPCVPSWGRCSGPRSPTTRLWRTCSTERGRWETCPKETA